jgi:tRNA-2-methylthio-N6-dimethylallyladenosine synthase
MTARLHELQDLIARQQKAFNASLVGSRCEVLFEKPGRNPGQIAGRSPFLQPVQVEAPETLIGEIATVEITGTGSNSLFARLATGHNVEVATSASA